MENHQFTNVGSRRQKEELWNYRRARKQKAIHKMALVSPYISIITPNINGLNLSTSHRVAGWIQKVKSNIMLPIYFSSKAPIERMEEDISYK